MAGPGLFKQSGQRLNPFRQGRRTPDDLPMSEQQRTCRMDAGIIEHYGVVSHAQGIRSAPEASPVPAANIGVRYVVASLRDPKAHAFNVQFRISQRNVHQNRVVSGILCPKHYSHCAMAGERRFQYETGTVRKQCSASGYRLARGREPREPGGQHRGAAQLRRRRSNWHSPQTR